MSHRLRESAKAAAEVHSTVRVHYISRSFLCLLFDKNPSMYIHKELCRCAMHSKSYWGNVCLVRLIGVVLLVKVGLGLFENNSVDFLGPKLGFRNLK